jgi:XTP/dITP diphosphohydrolase
MQQLLIATTNPGKLEEIKKFLGDIPYTLVSLKDAGIMDSVEETGKTFEENAILKARHYAKESGLMTLADDGGFEIDALHGEPGVKSHRWVQGNRESTDEELIEYTFRRMKDIPEGKRQAQLRLVLALVSSDGDVLATVEEAVRGVVPAKRSSGHVEGFPYRSILFLLEINKYYDQNIMTAEETEKYNHRKRAVEKLVPVLQQIAS